MQRDAIAASPMRGDALEFARRIDIWVNRLGGRAVERNKWNRNGQSADGAVGTKRPVIEAKKWGEKRGGKIQDDWYFLMSMRVEEYSERLFEGVV